MKMAVLTKLNADGRSKSVKSVIRRTYSDVGELYMQDGKSGKCINGGDAK